MLLPQTPWVIMLCRNNWSSRVYHTLGSQSYNCPWLREHSREKMRVILHCFLQFLQECCICGIPRSQTLFILQTHAFQFRFHAQSSTNSAALKLCPSLTLSPFNRQGRLLVQHMENCWAEKENTFLPPDCLDWKLLSWEQMEVIQMWLLMVSLFSVS